MKLGKLLAAALAAALILAACATKPSPQPEPDAAEPPVTEPAPDQAISRDSVEALHAQVLAARKDAFDLGAKDLLADDYAAAETRYVAGKAALDEDRREVAQTELQAALPLYRDLAERSARLAADRGKTDAAAARGRALAADASRHAPVSLAAAEAALAEAEAAMASGDSRAAKAAYARATSAFDAAEKRSRASVVKARVDELGFGPMDAGNYAIANEKYDQVDATIASDPATANDAAEEALLRYNLVLSKGWELSAGGKRDAAAKYKADSEGIKAQVAVKDDYAEAKAVWDEASYELAAGRNEAAAALFAKAEALFKAVYEKAAAKRAAAEEAMKRASASTEQSASTAQMGDMMLGTEADK